MSSKPPKVSIKWEDRTLDPASPLRYAILRWRAEGARQSRSLGWVTPEQAESLRADHEAALRLRVASPIDSAVVRVADVLDLYLQDVDRRPVSAGYGRMELVRCIALRRLLGDQPADWVTAHSLARYLGDRRREPTKYGDPPKRSSLLMEVDTLRRAFRCAISQRVLSCPIPDRPSGKLPQDRRPDRRLTEAEVGRLVGAGHSDFGAKAHGGRARGPAGLGWLLQVLAWSGRRPVAILELRVEDVARLLDPTVPRAAQLALWRRDKGGESLGWGPVTEPTRAALVARAVEVGSGRLWPDVQGSDDLYRPLLRVAAAAGVSEVQPYDLRRHAVTQVVAACDGQLKVAMRFTGHRTVATLLRYVYAEEGAAEDLAAGIGWSGLRAVASRDAEEG